MAYAKELTIALGQTVFAGDSQDEGERITSQEVRVEVTYTLERDDRDVPLLTSVKAAEVQHALTAARHQLRTRQEPTEAKPAVSTLSNGQRYSGQPRSGQSSNGASSVSPAGTAGRAGNGYTRPASQATPPVQDGITKPECITKTQKLAIQPMLNRLGLIEHEVRALLEEQFGKQTLDSLTREEGHHLLQALQRGEWEPGQREQERREAAVH